MYKPKLEKDLRCPLEYGLEMFGGKWKSRIVCVLAAGGTMRYSTLRREMVNITDAVLAAALKEMIADGLVSRRSYDEVPPRVEYTLTPMGQSVVPIFQSICRWAGSSGPQKGDAAIPQCRRCVAQNPPEAVPSPAKA